MTQVRGERNSVHQKTSMVEIQNEDLLCMARAIGVSWVKTIQVSTQEWQELTKDQANMTMVEKVLHHKKAPSYYYKDLTKKNKKEQKNLVVRLYRVADVPVDRMGNLNDLPNFEEVLGVQILVVSALRGNKFIRVGEIEKSRTIKAENGSASVVVDM